MAFSRKSQIRFKILEVYGGGGGVCVSTLKFDCDIAYFLHPLFNLSNQHDLSKFYNLYVCNQFIVVTYSYHIIMSPCNKVCYIYIDMK